MRSPLPADINARITALRYALICVIVAVHVPPHPDPSGDATGVLAFLHGFLVDGMFRAAVPMLTAISGYLLFRSGLDRTPGRLIERKYRSLVLPFLFWNAAYLGVFWCADAADLLPPSSWFHAYPDNLQVFLQRTFAIGGFPANVPLYFLRDLFLLALAAPLLGLFLRHAAWLGLTAVMALVLTLDIPYFAREDMAIAFYLGGMAALRGWNLRALDKYWPIAAMLFVVAGAMIALISSDVLFWFRVLSPVMIWPLSSLLPGTRVGAWLCTLAPASFFIFVSHFIVIQPLFVLLPATTGVLQPAVVWLISIVLVLIVCHLSFGAMSRLLPEFSRTVGGGRGPGTRRAPA